jgi:hypothetical protein
MMLVLVVGFLPRSIVQGVLVPLVRWGHSSEPLSIPLAVFRDVPVPIPGYWGRNHVAIQDFPEFKAQMIQGSHRFARCPYSLVLSHIVFIKNYVQGFQSVVIEKLQFWLASCMLLRLTVGFCVLCT